jgi:hypothetical protein
MFSVIELHLKEALKALSSASQPLVSSLGILGQNHTLIAPLARPQ